MTEKVRPALERTPQPLLMPPCRDPAVVPGYQHVWDRTLAPYCRPRIVRIFEQSPAIRLFERRLAGQDAWLQARDCINHDHRSQLAARKYVIADAQLTIEAAL